MLGAVSFRDLSKSYGDLQVVKRINIDIEDGEFVVLVGPSGCGKSTTLRMLAGLESITSGEVRIGDRIVNKLHPRERNIAMVFQDYALYPHKTVRDNLGFSLKVRKVAATEAQERIAQAAKMLGILHLLDRRPSQLSGGQRQRVAMGRAIVRRPEVFLFDEPLSNLDAKLRAEVRTEIKKLHQSLKTTIFYVTHDQVEAMTMADRIVILRQGAIEQVGTPDEVYNAPANVFVGGFIGSPAMNFVHGKMQEKIARCAANVAFDLRQLDNTPGDGKNVIIGLRPEHIRLDDNDEGKTKEKAIAFSGTVQVVEPLGGDTLVHVTIGKDSLTARLAPGEQPEIGNQIALVVDAGNVRLFDAKTESALH